MSLIAETANPPLENALLEKLRHRGDPAGTLGDLEPIAIRLALIQHSLKPRIDDAQLVVFAADHGLAVDGLKGIQGRQSDELAAQLLAGRAAMATLARNAQLALSVVDCGLASRLDPHERLVQRKIAHGTRNARVGQAMSIDQVHAAIRAGMEIADTLPGNLVACAGLGVGSAESAALVVSRLADVPIRELLLTGPGMSVEALTHLMVVTNGALGRHRDVRDPVEALAAFGGFETAMMVGVMLVAASKRHVVVVDGLAACAALMVATRIAPALPDYCVFTRSRMHAGLDRAMAAFDARALIDLRLDALDGTGACLAVPLLRGAAALLSDPMDGDDDLTRPAGIDAPVVRSLYDRDNPTLPGVTV